MGAAGTPFYKQGKRKKHREVRALTPVTQHGSAELRLELSGFWAYPVTTAREGRDVTEGTVRWMLGEVVLGRHGAVQVRSPQESIRGGKVLMQEEATH